MKKLLVVLLTGLLMIGGLASFSGCGNNSREGGEAQNSVTSDVTVRIGGMSGPTSMGLVKLMDDAEAGKTINKYEFAELGTEPAAFVAPLTKGELDMAAVPSNLASVLYNNNDGNMQVIAINTLGVLNIVERGNEINSLSDLKGKKIYATGQGATPEYNLRYLLSQSGIDPDNDVTIQFCADTTEILSYVNQDETAIAMVPQPFATVALSKVEGLRVALNLNDEWNKLDTGCEQVTGVIVVRKAFAEEYPDVVNAFLKEYEESINYVVANPTEASELIEKYGIVAAPVAEKALPNCNLKYESGSEMKESLSGYLWILYNENPKAIGGSMPADDFYYGL